MKYILVNLISIILIASFFSGCANSMQSMDQRKTNNFENYVKDMDESGRKSLMEKLVPYLIKFENNRI